MLTGVSHGNRSVIPCLKKIRVGSRHRVRYGKLLRSSLHSSPQVIFSGIQPTGIPHLGNYLGALKQWVRLQNEAPPNTQLIFSIVDLHAITVNQDAQQLRRWKRETLAALLSIGLDPKRSIIFYQSSVWLPNLRGYPEELSLSWFQVPAHAELMWILSCTASIGYLSRMTQWKVSGGDDIHQKGIDWRFKVQVSPGWWSITAWYNHKIEAQVGFVLISRASSRGYITLRVNTRFSFC